MCTRFLLANRLNHSSLKRFARCYESYVSMSHDLVTASTYLFVPANRPDRVEKAIATGVDEVIVDLEDAVGESEKDVARQKLAAMKPSRNLCVRINDESTSLFDADLEA